MKYGIQGIERSKTIKSTQIINKKDSDKAIIVNYLDGTQDVVDLTDENLKKIKIVVEKQGKMFAERPQFPSGPLLAASLLTFFLSIIVETLTPISVGIGFIVPVLSVLLSIRGKKVNNEIEKYHSYFLQIKGDLEQYKEVLEKSKQLTKSKAQVITNLEDVLKLDSISLKQIRDVLKDMNEKGLGFGDSIMGDIFRQFYDLKNTWDMNKEVETEEKSKTKSKRF